MTALHSPFRAGRTFTPADADALAAVLKALADPMRLRIINLIARDGSMTVTELVPELGITQPSVSSHVAVLEAAGLIAAERSGTTTHRRLVIDRAAQLSGLIDPYGGGR